MSCGFRLRELLRSVGDRDEPFPIQHGRGDEVTYPGSADPQDGTGPGSLTGLDIYIPDLRFGSGIKAPTRDCR